MKNKVIGFSRFSVQVSLFAILVLSCAGSVSAQWARTYGDASEEAASAIALTPDGGWVTAGLTASFGAGSDDYWIVKQDAAGTIQWEKAYGGIGFEIPTGIQPTTDGGYIVIGFSDSFGAGGQDEWIFKLDSTGDIQWQKTFGTAKQNTANDIRQTSDGGFIAAGEFQMDSGNYELELLKLGSSGGLQWQKAYGGADEDFAAEIRQTTDGGFIVVGGTKSFGAGDLDAWVLKLDSLGAVEWQKAFGGIGSDVAFSVEILGDGGFVVAGLTHSFGAGNRDLWVLRLTSTGNIQWQKTYGGPAYDQPSRIQPTADGGFLLSGSTMSFGAGLDDAWLLKLTSTGTIEWQKAFGGADSDFVNGALQTPDGGYVAAGRSKSFGSGLGDLWVLKLSSAGEIDPSCTLFTDTFVSPGSSFATVTNTAAIVTDTLGILQNTAVVPTPTTSNVAEQCAVPCLFCDDFEDGILDGAWAYLKPTWSESNGSLVATTTKKALAIATPAFAGCTDCVFEADIKLPLKGKAWIYGWYADSKNNVELFLNEKSDKFILKHRSAGKVAGKIKGTFVLLPETTYTVQLIFNGTAYVVAINGTNITSLSGNAPSAGTIGFQAKKPGMSIDRIKVD